jgi:GNAT superfamily N-acetyltransferase
MYMKIMISEQQLNKIVANLREANKKRKTFDFFDLVSKGILWVVEPHENGERVEPNWEHDTNLITLWNVEHPEPGQEWVKKAKHFTKNGSIKWWNEVGQFELSDDKYNQILRSIDLYKEKNKKDNTAKFIKCSACKKWFTQTIHKKKKSLPICPWCGKHNTHVNENQEVDERSRSFAFTRKKRLFSKPEMMANPDRYKKHDRDLKEIDRYKFSELGPKYKKKNPEEEYNEYKYVKENIPFLKEAGGFVYHYDVYSDGNEVVAIHVLDPFEKIKVAIAEFEMRSVDTFYITLPYVRPDYRKKGIALEIYKTVLKFGAIASGKAQSDQAVGLWKKMMKVLPNEVVFVDDMGKTHKAILKDDDIVVADSGKSVYAEKMGGFLKMYQS